MKNNNKVGSVPGFPLIRFIGYILGVATFAAAIPVLIFWYGELERERLIASYEVPSSFLDALFAIGHGPISTLMHGDETMLCAINGYGNVENHPALNAKQKTSLPKDKLPSVDFSWYLLFFNEDSVSRVYLIDNGTLEGRLEKNTAGCVTREGYFEILTIQHGNRDKDFTLHIMSKGGE